MYKRWEFRKNRANELPLRGIIYGQNSKFWQFWGLYSHISAPINVKFGTGGADLRSGPPVPNFTFIGATCCSCGAKNPFLDHWVRTIPACLRWSAGLPVISCLLLLCMCCRMEMLMLAVMKLLIIMPFQELHLVKRFVCVSRIIVSRCSRFVKYPN